MATETRRVKHLKSKPNSHDNESYKACAIVHTLAVSFLGDSLTSSGILPVLTSAELIIYLCRGQIGVY